MKLRDMLPYRAAALFSVLTAVVEADGLLQQYCSSQNTGSNQAAVYSSWQSNGACITQCQGSYSFGIVQGNNCWCSNYLPSIQLEVSQCSDTCPGFPSEHCGNVAAALFGYIYLNKTPAGTIGTTTSSASSSSLQSSAQLPQTDTVSLVVVQTVTESEGATTVVSYVTPSTSAPDTTSSTTSPSTSTSSSSTMSSAFSSSTAFSSSSSTVVPSLTAQIVTLSGQVVTQTVTATPIIASGQDAASLQVQQKDELSGGAIAGIVIGVFAVIGLLVLAGSLLWRRRKRQQDDAAAAGGVSASEKPAPTRNTSVLSRSGLLALSKDTNDNVEPNPFDEPGHGGTTSRRHSFLFGAAGAAEGISPSSPLGTSHSGDSRRHSKPMVYDQRLNPSALFGAHDNGSRVSMQDGADYSRTLGVTNPDPRPSWESRVSRG